MASCQLYTTNDCPDAITLKNVLIEMVWIFHWSLNFVNGVQIKLICDEFSGWSVTIPHPRIN